jgi:ABC-type antimicrobial peptide transport system permease subunit
MGLVGVSPNFAKVLPSYQLPIVKTYAEAPYDPYEYLYSPEGYFTCTMSEFAARKFNLIDSEDREFMLSIYLKDRAERLKLNMSTVFYQRLGLSYSRFDFIRHEVGVSFDTYAELAGLPSLNNLPLQRLKVKVKDPDNTKELASRIRSIMSTKNADSLWDYSELKQTIQRINNLLRNILNILLVLVLLISFFSLVTTSYVNIVNQSNEIAILLTIGYSTSRIAKIFVYESFVLVLSSCLVGVAVGTFVAWMMGLQRELFGDFPVVITIDGIWIIAVAAILSSLLSIIKPLSELFSQSINQIFMFS